MDKKYFVYIVTSKKNGTLYIGMTNNLRTRISQHKESLIPGFTQKYKVHMLVYFEEYQDVRDAITREKQMKRWKRDWKIQLIESMNPDWKDLFYLL
ncbi:MAG: GIY-YIG nuclease family protein [Ignavibacteriales bacterium]|nr:GIY-YIG nuclease family protein [Ignavibacteriales bacterium]